jgi:hypothetical protein
MKEASGRKIVENVGKWKIAVHTTQNNMKEGKK